MGGYEGVNPLIVDRGIQEWQEGYCTGKKKGVYKGEFFSPCTEEGAFPSSVSIYLFMFCLYVLVFRGLLGGKYPLIVRNVFLPQLVFVLFFVFAFRGVIRGAKPPLLIIAVYRINL